MDVVSSLERTSAKQDKGYQPTSKTDEAHRVTASASMPSPRSTFLICFLLALLFVFVIAGTPPGWGAGIKWTTRALAGVILVLLLAWHTRRRYYWPQTRSHQPTRVWRLPDNQVNILQRSAGQTKALSRLNEADSARARAFTSAILFPASVRQRITERYEPSQRTLTQHVTIDAQLHPRVVRQILHPEDKTIGGRQPSVPLQRQAGIEETRAEGSASSNDAADRSGGVHDQPVILFPVLVPRKGEMVDNLRVLAADGSALPVLSYRQYLQLIAQVLRTLLDIAYGADISQSTHSKAFEAEHIALRAVMRRAENTEPDDDDSGSHELDVAANLTDGPKVVNSAALRLAAQLVKKLTSHYAVVAAIPCPPDGRFVVSYERMMTPALELAPIKQGVLSWLKARARLLLGSRPVDFSISLDNAWTTQSYHLLIDAQDGVFVGVQESEELIGYLDAHWNRRKEIRRDEARKYRSNSSAMGGAGSTVESTTPPPYYRFRRRAGQRYAHFYTRFFPEPMEELKKEHRMPNVRFRFYEVPPGSVFRAVITASAAALLIWLIGFVASRKADPGTDVPAFLLVFPAVAAAWLGFDGQPRRLLEGTLAARISLVTTVLCSIAASGLFMIHKADLPYFRWENVADMQVLGIASLAWSVLTVLAVLNAAAIGYAYLARTWEFMHLSSRPDNFGGPKENVG
ncbi:hypothetical protein [Micromonospora sp. 4G55]|uniref:hypothetical protein n=1 Tax=Micromonospora sp. 4G55 TaxID=2806102 RepID=UPI001A55BC84|nr:hypothetical protein [Micromonospora sp. 4G55]MBM0255699.1 hypothetical protein [Micromonospora sp. 4G55]